MARAHAADDLPSFEPALELRRARDQAVRSDGDEHSECSHIIGPRDRTVVEGREEFRPFRDCVTR
jgi:hypothetical protein